MTSDNGSVLVVGGGLGGLATAVFLAHYGTRVTVAERALEPSSTTRYQRLDVRTMEILRGLGLEAAVRSTGSHPETLGDLIQADTVAGVELGRQAPPLRDEVVPPEISPVQPHRCQDRALRALLRDRAAELGVDIRAGVELLDAEPDDDRVSSRVRGAGGEATIRSSYVVGADGTDSRVRELAGIPTSGPDTVGRQFSVFFRADLRDALRGRRFAAIQIKKVGATLLDEAEESEPGAWCLVQSLGLDAQPPSAGALSTFVREAVGDDQLAVDVSAARTSPVRILCAERFHDGRFVLVGDAACTTPTGPGLSGDTILQDAQNVAWKLSAVLSGVAGPQLLDTYDAERRPLAELATKRALAFAAGPGRAAGPRKPAGPPSAAARPPAGSPDQLSVALGARYASTAVVGASDGGFAFLDPRSASGEPGMRAPHLDIDLGGDRMSVVELYGKGLVLVVGAQGQECRQAAEAAAARLAVPLTVYQVGVELHETGVSWAKTHGVADTGAVLVRPDGVVGWRCVDLPRAPGAEIDRVFRSLLSRTDVNDLEFAEG